MSCPELTIRKAGAIPLQLDALPGDLSEPTARSLAALGASSLLLHPETGSRLQEVLGQNSAVQFDADPRIAFWGYERSSDAQRLYIRIGTEDFVLHAPPVRGGVNYRERPVVVTARSWANTGEYREGHWRRITGWAASDQHPWVVIARRNVTTFTTSLVLWNSDTGAQRDLHAPLTVDPKSLTFSKDGDSFAAVSRGQVTVYSINQPTIEIRLPSGIRPYRKIVFSDNGRYLAAAMADGGIHVFDLESSTPLAEAMILNGHHGEVLTMQFSSDGSNPTLVTGGTDGTARLWSLEGGGRQLRLFDTASDRRLVFLPRQVEEALFAGSLEGVPTLAIRTRANHLTLWNLDTAEEIPARRLFGFAATLAIRIPASEWSRFASATSYSDLTRPDLPPGGEFLNSNAISYTPSRGRIAAINQVPEHLNTQSGRAPGDPAIVIWNTHTGRLADGGLNGTPQEPRDTSAPRLTGVQFVDDGRRILVSDTQGIRVWEWVPQIGLGAP